MGLNLFLPPKVYLIKVYLKAKIDLLVNQRFSAALQCTETISLYVHCTCFSNENIKKEIQK